MPTQQRDRREVEKSLRGPGNVESELIRGSRYGVRGELQRVGTGVLRDTGELSAEVDKDIEQRNVDRCVDEPHARVAQSGRQVIVDQDHRRKRSGGTLEQDRAVASRLQVGLNRKQCGPGCGGCLHSKRGHRRSCFLIRRRAGVWNVGQQQSPIDEDVER